MHDIPIVFITDNGYVVPTIVAIESLIKNSTKDKKFSIKVVYANLTLENKQYIINCGNDSSSIELIPVDVEKYNQYTNKNLYVTPTALIKFELANIFKSYDKILYIDGDVIIRKDISGLLDIDIDDNYGGVVKDIESSISELSAQRLKLDGYFNSGVMLLNLNRIRQDKLPAKMLEIKSTRLDLYYMDQDVLNLAFNNKVKFLPVRYNYIKNSYLHSRIDIKIINDFFSSRYESIEGMEEDAIIVHLAGARKPWKDQGANCFREWMNYYESSPLKDHNLNLLPEKRISLFQDLAKKIIKRKSIINSEGDYEIMIYVMGLTILSKIRKYTHIEYRLFGYIKIKNQFFKDR